MARPPDGKLRLAVLTAGLLLGGAGASAQNAAERLAAYEYSISGGDPAAAAAFLGDHEARDLAAGEQKAPALASKAEALKDLKDLLAMPWDPTKANNLSQALSIRIDADKPLARVGIGPEPEKLLAWLEKYQPAYPRSKKEAVKKAIRQWDIVFGTMTELRAMNWDQATLRSGRGVTVTKTAWAAMVIGERNAVISQLMKQDPAFMVYDDALISSARDQAALQRSVNRIKASGTLSQARLAQLSGKPLADQAYLLGNFFDGGAAGNDDVDRIHAARDSLPKEVLPARERELLAGMVGTAVAKELAGTRAGDKVLAFYAKENKLKIEIRPCDGKYSRYDPGAKTIILDSETIQQYMRLNGYTAGSVMRSRRQVEEIVKYVSPAVVYESAHQMQDAWAKSGGVYKPRVQEDEIEAMALEGLYTSEKLRGDAAFREIMEPARKFSSYAAKRVEVATEYGGLGAKRFAATVRQRYFSGLPSLDAAAAQVLGAVSEELARRSGLAADERAGGDAAFLGLAEALEMTPEELAGSAGEIRGDVLAKIERDLSGLGLYKSRYSAADRECRKALKTLKIGPAGGTAAPPAL
ncbi:MAG TPA: hypothetical protein DCS63_04210 [Elusimicrobia bacterium]|nr:hypothetical protein [Elusimicrobiota bacterium]